MNFIRPLYWSGNGRVFAETTPRRRNSAPPCPLCETPIVPKWRNGVWSFKKSIFGTLWYPLVPSSTLWYPLVPSKGGSTAHEKAGSWLLFICIPHSKFQTPHFRVSICKPRQLVTPKSDEGGWLKITAVKIRAD